MPYANKKPGIASPHEVDGSVEPKDGRGRVPNPSEWRNGEDVNTSIPGQRGGSISPAKRTPRFIGNQNYR